MSLLFQKQTEFTKLVPLLLQQASLLGFSVTLGDAFRDPRVFGPLGTRLGYGDTNSCHKLRLAIDLNLFRDGAFLANTSDHLPLGEWWEKQHPDARWGGRFNDGNHYSFEFDGHK